MARAHELGRRRYGLSLEAKANVFDVDLRNEQTGGFLHFICNRKRISLLKQLPSCGSSAFRRPSLRPAMCSMTYEAARLPVLGSCQG
jgi:hypothetical protein